MKYTIFNTATGQIERVVSCPSSMVHLQYDPQASSHIEGEYPDDQFYIANGQPVPLPAKPSEHHVFDYNTKQWVDPRTPETEWPLVRSKRNSLLAQSDWTQLPDVSFVDQQQWATYRQALRDVTDQPDPFNIVWPVAPG
jgi:hypothetical protein